MELGELVAETHLVQLVDGAWREAVPHVFSRGNDLRSTIVTS
jgi:hypothetical protein